MNESSSNDYKVQGWFKILWYSIRMRWLTAMAILVLAVLVYWYYFRSCCAPPPIPDRSPTPTASDKVFAGDTRRLLTYDELMNGFAYSSPTDNRALAVPEGASLPAHIFEGRLELVGEVLTGKMRMLRSETGEPEIIHLPEFEFEFVQSDAYLIPIQRGLIVTDHPYWNYIIEPGRVWQEPGDQGYSRASFPFALVWKGSNAVFNGVMTFLFNHQSVSKVWYQITQETTASLNADLWGLLDARYHPEKLASAREVKEEFAREQAGRFPAEPVQALVEDYPEIDISAFGSGITPAHMTWYGVVVNGTNYLGGCSTRYGPYPYCEYLRAPSYSTAKSAFVAAALMRLAQIYGDEVPSAAIADYVPEAAASRGDWTGVTFDHTLDMATGNYRSSAYMVDEEQWDADPFWFEESFTARISAAFDWPHSAEPGTRWVYRTSDTFILAQALQNYLRSKQSPEADIFQFVVDEIYIPLGLGPGVFSTLRTNDDNWQGQPYGGYGMWWIPDDIAKIASMMFVDGGRIDGVQILDPGLLAAALQQDDADRGLPIDSRRRYNNSFWADHYTRKDGFSCDFWVPQMLGYSGIVVAFFPNGVIYYYASDNFEFTWEAALRESNKIAPLCD